MEYPVDKIPYKKLTIGPTGFLESLCSSCQSRDCTNPIISTDVSEVGVTKKARVWQQGGQVYIVVSCPSGYTK